MMYRKTAVMVVVAAIVSGPGAWAQTVSYSTAPAPQTDTALEGDKKIVDTQLVPGFYPALTVAAVRHSNGKKSSNLRQAEIEYTASAGLTYKAELGQHDLQLFYGATVISHSKFKQDNYIQNTLGAGLNLDLTDRFNLLLDAGYVDGAEPRGSTGSRLVGNIDPDTYHLFRYGAEGIYGRRSNTMQVSLAAHQQQLRYTNNQQGFRDRDRLNLRGRAYYNLGPSTATFVELTNSTIDYLTNNRLDSTEQSYSVGARWEATDITSAEVSIGNLTKNFDDPTVNDFSGVTYLGKVLWAPQTFTNVSLYTSRRTEESSEPGSSYFVSNLLGVSVDYAYSDSIGLLAYTNYTKDDFSDTRRDTTWDYGLGMDYTMRPWLFLGLRAGQTSRSSNVSAANYDDQFIGLSVTMSNEPAK
ncbi:MAG TPA: hypothetical protein ENI62_02410 [Gammaproteobacteria bacterium]|nr:hypothetical protein [Gammaproteobacteria bacterium]